MLTKRYLASVKNLPDVMSQIVKGTAPETFNIDHLKGLGFNSSNDRAIIPLLKDLGFLNESGAPTARYHAYRAGDKQSKAVMGEALLEAYGDLFHVNANPTDRDREAIKGKFKTAHNVTDRVAEQQVVTFYALLKLADLEAARTAKGSAPSAVAPLPSPKPLSDDRKATEGVPVAPTGDGMRLRYNIEVHLPATKEVEVYNAIFKALKEHLA